MSNSNSYDLSTLPSYSIKVGIKEILKLSIPTIINMSSLTINQFIDAWMISLTGPTQLAAQYGAGVTSFCTVCIFFGIVASTNIFASQCLGARRYREASSYCWQGIWLAIFIGLGLFCTIFCSRYFFTSLGHEPKLVEQEVIYYNTITYVAPLVLTAKALGGFFIGIHRPHIVLIAGIISDVVKIGVGYCLIFGNFGFPRMELRGAGISTIIAVSVELMILGYIFLFSKITERFNTRSSLKFSFFKIKKLLQIGFPNGLMLFNDTVVWMIFFVVIIATLGTEYIASGSILNRYWQLILMPAIGVGQATVAIVGKYCGARRTDLATKQAFMCIAITLIYTTVGSLLLWYHREGLVSFFNSSHDPTIQTISSQMFIYMLICQAFEGLCIICLGALRGAGDTLWPCIAQFSLAVTIGIGASWGMIKVFPELGVTGPWITGCIYECGYGLLVSLRFISGKWKKISLLE